MPFADSNGQKLFFEDTGGDGPPLVLSHGFLMDHEMFAPQVAALSDVYRVVTWDERGFGATESDGRPFTYWDSARDLFGLLDVLGIERAVLGGVSQGGYLSLRAALLHPDRVRALVLIDTQAAWDPARLRPAGSALLERDDISDRLEELAMPVLLVRGTEDSAIPVSRAHDICAAVSDCRGVVEVEGAAHASNLTHPHVVNPAIRSFLEGLPA